MSERIGSHYNRYTKNTFSEFNANQYNGNDYNNVYDPNFNKQYSTSQEPDVEYEQVEHYLTVSSRERDVSIYPDPNHYVITFPREFKNIYSIELIQSIIPAQNAVEEEPYLLLHIDEIEDVMVSTNRNISDAFAILQMTSPVTANGFMNVDKRIHENTVKYYRIPKATLAKMTVTITDWAGTPFDFGTDAPDPPNKTYQNLFVFRVVCLEKKRAQLNHRNVF